MRQTFNFLRYGGQLILKSTEKALRNKLLTLRKTELISPTTAATYTGMNLYGKLD